jgi:hypothetical protein
LAQYPNYLNIVHFFYYYKQPQPITGSPGNASGGFAAVSGAEQERRITVEGLTRQFTLDYNANNVNLAWNAT